MYVGVGKKWLMVNEKVEWKEENNIMRGGGKWKMEGKCTRKDNTRKKVDKDEEILKLPTNKGVII